MSRLFPKLDGRKEYSVDVDGLMTTDQLSQWLKDMDEGFGKPGALQWLADSYRALLQGASKPEEEGQLSLWS